MELTKEQFAKEIGLYNAEGMHFNVESEDTGSVYVRMYGCIVSVTLENGICGEVTVFKPLTEMEITLDFDIVDTITKEEDGLFRLELAGMPDIVIRAVQ